MTFAQQQIHHVASYIAISVDYSSQNGVFLRSLSGLKAIAQTDEENNTTYTFDDLPDTMSIYPVNFKMKDKVTNYLDKWNSKDDITLYAGSAQSKTLTQDDRVTD